MIEGNVLGGNAIPSNCAKWASDTMPIDLELGSQATPFDMNDCGQVVGADKSHDTPFLWLPAAAYSLTVGLHQLETPGTPGQAVALNNHGEVIGSFVGGDGKGHAFL